MQGGACQFCKPLAGTYDYEEAKRLAKTDPQRNPFSRHRHCRCTVVYDPRNGKRQDVWSKKWKDIDKSDKIILRKELNKIPNSTLNAHTLKKLEEQNWTPSFKAKAIKFYRETSKAGVEFSDHSIARTLQRVINDGLMNQEEILQLLKGKAQYVQDDGKLVFNRGNVYFIKNQNTGDIVSVVIRDEPKESWRETNG